jgi:NADPH-dependent ferric siderophore reductase
VSSTPNIRRVRHETRFRRLAVEHVEYLTPKMVRMVVGGDELRGFTSLGFDDHVKLIFPTAPEGELRLPSVGANGPAAVDDVKPIMRDYTPRRYEPDTNKLLLDFVIHDAGPATTWAASAAPGHSLGVGGPRGSFIIPTDIGWHLLIGDESALPAIGRRLEELPAGARAVVVAEIENAPEQQVFQSSANFEVVWAHRRSAQAGSPDLLLNALRSVRFPAGQCFAWAAAESRVARAVRNYLIEERGLDRHWIKAAGYWQLGATGTHDSIAD